MKPASEIAEEPMTTKEEWAAMNSINRHFTFRERTAFLVGYRLRGKDIAAAIEAERREACPNPAEHYDGWADKYDALDRSYERLAAKCRAMEAVVGAAVVWSDWMDNHVITTYVEQEHSLLERVDEYEAALAAADNREGRK